MSILHLHLLLNHVPVIGIVFALLLLGVAWMRRSDELGKAALGLLALLGLVSIVVFLTGEPAEEIAEQLPGFSETLTERHEEAARVATIVMAASGVLALMALWRFRHRALARWVVPAAMILSLGAAAPMAYAANLGGMIRHTEIRGTEVPTSAAPSDDRQSRGSRLAQLTATIATRGA